MLCYEKIFRMYKKRKKIINQYKTRSKYLAALFIGMFVFLIFNDVGIIQWIKLSKHQEKNHLIIQELLEQQIKLKDEISKLQNDEEYLELIARERFLMVKKGEKVFRVIDTKELK